MNLKNILRKGVLVVAGTTTMFGCAFSDLYQRTFRGMYDSGCIYTVNDRNNDGKLDDISIITHLRSGPNGGLRKIEMLDNDFDGKFEILKEDITFYDSQGKEKRREIATLIDIDKDGDYEKGEIQHISSGKIKKFKLYPKAYGIVEDSEDSSKLMHVKFGSIESFIKTCKSLAEKAEELAAFYKR